MTLLLLAVLYIAFIGLGVPDSLIGSAWPAIYTEFNIPVSYISFITFTISGCTVLSSIFSDRIIKKLGTGITTAISTLLTAVAILGFSVTDHFVFMWLLSIPLGIGAGAIDSGLNNYIALHYSAKHMNLLHCFYGIGVSCSPYLMSLALAGDSWRMGYQYTFWIQIAITAIVVISLPLWRKKTPQNQSEDVETRILPVRQMVKMPALRLMWLLMFITNALETACGAWGSTYLVRSRGFSAEDGAMVLVVFYVGLTLGRLISGLLAQKIGTWKRVIIGHILVAVAVVMMFIPVNVVVIGGFFMMGLGNSSIYPNLIYLTPYNFGEDVSQSIMGSQIAAAYSSVMLTSPLLSLVDKLFSLDVFPVFVLLLFAVMAITVFFFIGYMKREGKYNPNV